ncbi:MAG: hypothetical protein ACE5R4_04195 [Armatimonadota bacterium]
MTAAALAAGATALSAAPRGRPTDKWRARPKVLLLIHNPIIEAREGRRLHHVMGWNDPDELTRAYIEDVSEVSGGLVRYRIAERLEVDGYPIKADGFRYTDGSYLRAWEEREFHQPDGVDYRAIIEEFGICEKVENRQIDEVFLFGAPYFGYYESIMVGKGAYWCNAPPLDDVDCSRRFVIMGFNYERGVGEMLEDLGHRTESILWHVYGSWEPKETHAWNRFTLTEKALPGKAGCGNVHYAPNSESDYDWGNQRYVWSTCDDWYNYPNLTGEKRRVNCEEWGGGDIRAHHKWWFDHIPRAPGKTDGHLNNWWKYIIRFDRYDE